MNRIHRKVLIILFGGCVIFSSPTVGQELNCSVTVNYRNLTGNDYTFLDELGDNVREYMNQRRWTEDRFEELERIECSMQVVFTEAISLTRFRVRLILSSRRPIYGTTQPTTVLQLNDENWLIDYSRGTPLIFEPDRFQALTSVLNFYAYLMLGYDYDTFANMGGTVHFEKARRIAELARSSGAIGWAQTVGDASRGELISQIMDPRYRSIRTAYWDYHFTCLDHFIRDPDAARESMIEVIDVLETMSSGLSRAYYLDQFFTAKYKEITAVFEGSTFAGQAYDTLSRIDPSHLSEYSGMLQ